MVNHASAILILMFGAILGLPSHADMGVGLSAQEFRLDSEGQVVVIDPNGAELYLDYIGDPRPESENIKITINDPGIRIMSGNHCAIKNPARDCKIVLYYKNIKNPSYGQKTLSVLDGNDRLIKEHMIWVKPNKGEEEIPWVGNYCVTNGPVFLQNGTSLTGVYRWIELIGRGRSKNAENISQQFSLPPYSICYIDKGLVTDDYKGGKACGSGTVMVPNFRISSSVNSSPSMVTASDVIIEDNSRSYNGLYNTGSNNISACATEGARNCAKEWGSWTVGLMNLSGKTLRNDGQVMRPGEIKYQDNRAWDSGSTVYWTTNWSQERVALFSIHGTTDGSDFDPIYTTPPVQAVQTAPPCSKFLNKPKPAEKRVTLTVNGPGDVVEERGFRTVSNFSTLWVVDDGSLFVATAVPNEGHQFVGWSGANCDNNSLTCAVNITSDITIKAEFK